MALTRSFSDKLAKKLGANPEYVWEIMQKWAHLEGTGAKNNPLATTQKHARSIDPWNSLGGGIGVQQYADEDAGVEATYQTLTNGFYPNIVAGLKSGAMNWNAVDAELRKWSGSGYGASALSGAPMTGEPGQSGGGGSVADPLTGTYEAVLAQIAAMQQNPPQPGTDEYLDWLVELSQLATIARQLKPDSSGSRDPNDTATADFQNRIQDNQLDLAFDQTTLSRAIADIDRFLGGKEESRARASQIFDAQKFLSAYGTSPGKSSFSLADLGSGFEAAGARMGLDPNKPFLNYTGTVRIDPEADMARFDSMFGVTGEMPGLPGLITNPANFPDAPGLDFATDYGGGADYYQAPAAPGAAPNIDIDNGPPGSSVGVPPPGVPIGAEFATPSSFPGNPQNPPSPKNPTRRPWWLAGNDNKYFGIGGLDDLTPGIPSSYSEWLLGDDGKFFGIPVNRPSWMTGGKPWHNNIPMPMRNPVYRGGSSGW